MTDPALDNSLNVLTQCYRDAIVNAESARVKAAEARAAMNGHYGSAAEWYARADGYGAAVVRLGGSWDELAKLTNENLGDILRDDLDRHGHRADNDETDWHAP